MFHSHRPSWLAALLRSWLGARPAQQPRRRFSRLRVEELEARVTPTAYTVNVLGDASGLAAGSGSGTSGDLRYCMNKAIADKQTDTITFSPSVFTSTQTITLSSSLVTAPSGFANPYGLTAFIVGAGDNITINGVLGPNTLGITIAGGNATRLFAVEGAGTLNLQNLTLSGGSAAGGAGGQSHYGGSGGGGAGLGGAVWVDSSTFTANGCTFVNNTASGGAGGGKDVIAWGGGGGGGIGGAGVGGPQGTSMNKPYNGPGGAGGGGGGAGGRGFSNISAGANGAPGIGGGGGGGGGGGSGGGGGGGAGGGHGGAINTNPNITVAGGSGGFGGGHGGHGDPHSGSTGLGNGGGGGGGGGLGGAIFSTAGTVTLTNDTFTQNAAHGGAGGSGRPAFTGVSPPYTGASSAAGAPGQGDGGAVFVRNGTLTATFVTFSSNTGTNGDGSSGTASNLFVLSDAGQASATIINCILGQNATTTVSDFYATKTSASGTTAPNLGTSGRNLVSNNPASPNGLTGTFTGTNPNFAAAGLASNGGSTQTIALTSSSTAALSQGATGTGITVDQRGDPRPAATPDVGAFEFTYGTPTANAQAVTVNENGSIAVTLTGSDPDTPPPSLTYTVTVQPQHGSLSGSAPNLTYTPTAGYAGSDSFQFTDSNGIHISSAATVSIYVSGQRTLVVNVPGDTSGLAGGTGSGNSGDLRYCIAQANLNHGLSTSDTIQFSVSGVINLAQALPAINDNVAMTAPTSNSVTINGNNLGSVFTINAGETVSFSGLTITGGNGFFGAGIYSNSGTVTVNNCTLSGNAAAYGGGILSNGTMTVSNCTLSGNSASGFGGGIYNGGALTVSNCTLSGNSGSSYGGGIINNGGTMAVLNSTLSGNFVSGSGNYGGGIANFGTMTLHDTIVAGNSALTTATDPDVAGGVTASVTIGGVTSTEGYNLIGNGTGSGGFTNNDQVGTSGSPISAHLGPLQNNGGPTQTMALLPNSPAINAGDPNGTASLPQYDQGGQPFVRYVGTHVDIGAYEHQTNTYVVSTLSDVNNGNYGPGYLSLREAIGLADNDLGSTIIFNPSLSGDTIQLTGHRIAITAPLTITGPGAGLLTIDAQTLSQIFFIDGRTNGVINVNISGLTLKNGNASGVDGGVVGSYNTGQNGGAIFNDLGNLTLQNDVLSGNTANYDGGAILNNGTLTVSNTTFSNNQASNVPYEGGGIANDGSLTVTACTFANNTAYVGGGLYNGIMAAPTAAVTGSTFTGNTAVAGGGILNNSGTLTIGNSTVLDNTGEGIQNAGTLTVSNSTISGNTTALGTGFAGGINTNAYNVNAATTLYNVTIANNTNTAGGPGGLTAQCYTSNTCTVTLANTLVANSVNFSTAGSGTFVSLGHNLSSDATGTSFLTQAGDLNGTNPLLGTLATTATTPAQSYYPLLPGSPAIDAGNNANALSPDGVTPLTTDQRGAGFARIVGPVGAVTTVDMGALELQTSAMTTTTCTVVPSVNTPAVGQAVTFTATVTGLAAMTFGTVTFYDGATALAGSTTAVNSSGQGTFITSALAAGAHTITAQYTGAGGFASSSSPGTSVTEMPGLTVTSFTPLPTGFKVAFSKPLTTSLLELYGSGTAAANAASLTLVGKAGGTFKGSLILNATTTGFTFLVGVTNFSTGTGQGLLPADTYTVTLLAGGHVAGVTLGAGGSGYSAAAPPFVVFTGGGGSGAAGTAVVNGGGAVTGVTITSPGTGYTSAPTLSLFANAGSGATAAASISGFFQDTSSEPLDGNSDGTGGDNYTTVFTYATAGNQPAGTVTVSLPQFARGPETNATPANLNLPNNTSNLIPIVLSNGSGVTSVDLFLQYNPSDLAVSNVSVNAALTGSTFTKMGAATNNGDGTVTQEFLFTTGTALAASTVTLGGLQATVPFSVSIYQQKNLLHVTSLTVNGAANAAAVDGLDVVAYLGDNDGNGQYSGNDTQLLSRVLANLDTGFAKFSLVDPAVLDDVNADSKLNSTDATQLTRFITNTNGGSTFIPVPPSGLTFPTPGPDPSVSLPTVLSVGASGTVTVPVNLDDPRPVGSTGMTQALLALTYDPAVFSVSPADIHLGMVPASGSGWTVTATVNPLTGQLAIDLYSATPISDATGGSLVTIDFHRTQAAASGLTPIHLVAAVDPTGTHVFRTEIDDSQGAFTLSPAANAAAVVTLPGTTSTGGGVVVRVAAPGSVEPDVQATVTFTVALVETADAKAAGAVPQGDDEPPTALPATDGVAESETGRSGHAVAVRTAGTVGLAAADTLVFPVVPVIVAAAQASSVVFPLNNVPGISALTLGSLGGQNLAEVLFLAVARGAVLPADLLLFGGAVDATLDALLAGQVLSRSPQDKLDALRWDGANAGPDGLHALDAVPAVETGRTWPRFVPNPVPSLTTSPEAGSVHAALDQYFALTTDDADQSSDD